MHFSCNIEIFVLIMERKMFDAKNIKIQLAKVIMLLLLLSFFAVSVTFVLTSECEYTQKMYSVYYVLYSQGMETESMAV